MTLPLSLYIHLPWCMRKCPYCDFNSHEAKNVPEQAYVAKLLHDWQQELPHAQGRSLISIFFGGGTPSLFSAEAINQILTTIQQDICFASDIEITLEANPGTVEQQRFLGYRQAGVNRISLGIQSFQKKYLQKLGRIHDEQEALTAVHTAKQCGFTNINLDLMFGLPQQTFNDAMIDLQTAIGQNTTHLSWYQLTLEPNTYFAKFPPRIPHDDLIWEMQIAGEKLLSQHDLTQYEVSAYAKNNFQCRHNFNYWQFGDYIGIGAGAHGKISFIKENKIKIIRTQKISHPQHYLAAENVTAKRAEIDVKQIAFEFMLNACRLFKKINKPHFEKYTGVLWQTILPILHAAQQKELIHLEQDGFLITAFGRKYLNDLVGMFLR